MSQIFEEAREGAMGCIRRSNTCVWIYGAGMLDLLLTRSFPRLIVACCVLVLIQRQDSTSDACTCLVAVAWLDTLLGTQNLYVPIRIM